MLPQVSVSIRLRVRGYSRAFSSLLYISVNKSLNESFGKRTTWSLIGGRYTLDVPFSKPSKTVLVTQEEDKKSK